MSGKRILGLDLGTSSVGWALIDESKSQIVATGVRVFPEGVARDKGREVSKNKARREARGKRKQSQRRRRRKQNLKHALTYLGLYPADSKAREELAKINPYALRARALDEQLSLHELGRVILHLNQRRGFKSNARLDKSNEEVSSDMLLEISELASQIHASGSRSLGEYLHGLTSQDESRRLRGRHTRRDMLLGELLLIWHKQSVFYPELLTHEVLWGTRGEVIYPTKPEKLTGNPRRILKEFGLVGLVFFQRKMYWPKSLVGTCELDPKSKRCPRADRIAQRFRVLQEVNNLEVIKSNGEVIPLTDIQRAIVFEQLSKRKEVKFDALKKKLNLLPGDFFNLEAGDRTKLLGMSTDAHLAEKKYFGSSWWTIEPLKRDLIVRSLLHDDEEVFLQRAVSEFGFDSEIAEQLLMASLEEGYASYGQTTLEKLVPFLEKRLPLTSKPGEPCAIREAGFIPSFERPNQLRPTLPNPPELTNPIVRRGLGEVRKVVNAVIREYGLPDQINVELARETKGTEKLRTQRIKTMRKNELERKQAKERIEEYDQKATRNKILAYRLWEQQETKCMYSGRTIGINQLFSSEVNIDHVLPYSRSLDDSQSNKVLCFRDENAEKGQQTVSEWLKHRQPDKYEKIMQRASQLPYEIRVAKKKKLAQESCDLTDFINRDLNDTAYITASVVEYLKCLGCQVIGTKGLYTATLRYQWGLNDLLRSDGLNLKSRDDHRHHAVDAVVIALTNQHRLRELAKHRGRATVSPAWSNLRADVESAVNGIWVSHRPERKVRGQLHEDTHYGPTQETQTFVMRKELKKLDNVSTVQRIRDHEVRRVVMERLKELGVSGGKIPKDAFANPLFMTSKSGKAGTKPAVIKKVRVLKNDKTIRPLGDGKYVKPGGIHHVAIFEEVSGDKAKLVCEWVTMLEAARRKSRGEPIIQRNSKVNPKRKFNMSLSRGEMLMGEYDGELRLFKYQKGVTTRDRFSLVDHADARESKTDKFTEVSVGKMTFRKVTVDPLGRLRWAND